MYAHKTIKELQSMADEIKEQAKKYDYAGTAKKVGSAIEESLSDIGGFAIRVADKSKEKAKSK